MSMNWGYVAFSAGNLAHSQLIYQRYGLTTELSPFKFAFIVSSFLLLCNKIQKCVFVSGVSNTELPGA
jgi:hypothetical protein